MAEQRWLLFSQPSALLGIVRTSDGDEVRLQERFLHVGLPVLLPLRVQPELPPDGEILELAHLVSGNSDGDGLLHTETKTAGQAERDRRDLTDKSTRWPLRLQSRRQSASS